MRNSTIKSCLIVSLLILSSEILNAQIAKGTIRLGPHIDFSSSTTELDGLAFEIKNSSLTIGASAGYFIIDNLQIGISAAIISERSEFDNFKETSSGVALGPLIEYKIGLSNEFFIPIGGGLAYNSITSDDDLSGEITYSGISYGAWAGLEFIANNKLGAALIIGPQFGTLKHSDSDSEFDLNTISASIEVSFYF